MNQETLILHNGTAVLPDRLVEDAVVLCLDGRIERVGARAELDDLAGGLMARARSVDARGGIIAPGFVDIHVHGGGGADYMDGTEEAVVRANRVHAKHGTTTIFPTTTTGSPAQIEAMLQACLAVQKRWTPSMGARLGGVHFYGPYFAEEKVGCHLRSGRRDPDRAEYERSFDLGIIRVATCAAELPGAEEFYRAAARRGCLVTCGHSNASWSEMARAYAAGMRHVDHFWCAMSSVPSMRARFGTPSQGSMEQFVLMHREMSTEVIADGCHLAPELLEFAWVMKGSDRLCLVTDANRAVDMPPGQYRFGPIEDGEWFESDALVGRHASGGLASSVVGMDTMVRNMVRLTSAGLLNVIRMAALTPAQRVGMANEIGSLDRGKQADLLVLNRHLSVERVFIGGMELTTEQS